jgi:hypothetical protein
MHAQEMLMPSLLSRLVVNEDLAPHDMNEAMLTSMLGWCHQWAKGRFMRVHLHLR